MRKFVHTPSILPLNRLSSDRSPDSVKGESHDWGPWDVADSDFGDTRITDWAIERLGTGKKKPFFLAVGYYRPHIPLYAPARFFERFQDHPAELPPVRADDLDDLSETAREWALKPVTAGSHATTIRNDQWGRAVEAYLACTTWTVSRKDVRESTESKFAVARRFEEAERAPCPRRNAATGDFGRF